MTKTEKRDSTIMSQTLWMSESRASGLLRAGGGGRKQDRDRRRLYISIYLRELLDTFVCLGQYGGWEWKAMHLTIIGDVSRVLVPGNKHVFLQRDEIQVLVKHLYKKNSINPLSFSLSLFLSLLSTFSPWISEEHSWLQWRPWQGPPARSVKLV